MPIDLPPPVNRRFARLTDAATPEGNGYVHVPNDGMCLNAFLILRPNGRGGEVLMGRLNREAPWDRIGGLAPERVTRIGHRWMLPSSQLLLFESPSEAVRRIVHEQLGATLSDLRGPAVFSESYRRPGADRSDPHWDLQFVFEGRWPEARFPQSRAFTELAFVDIARTPRGEIARSQADVLELVGLSPAP
jgi:hypothetical protein